MNSSLRTAALNSIAAETVVSAVGAFGMPVVITNPWLPDNPVVLANDAFCLLSGYDREDILGRNCRFLQGPHTDPESVAMIRKAVQQVMPIKIDILNYRKDGSTFWNRLLMTPVPDANGGLGFFVAVQIDVTSEHEHMASLAVDKAALADERESRLRMQQEYEREQLLALKAARLGGWRFESANAILTVSNTFQGMLGYPTDQPFTHDDLLNAIHVEDRDRVISELGRWPTDRPEHQVSCRFIRPDGEVRWIALRGQAFLDGYGRATRISGVAADLTDDCRNEHLRAALVNLKYIFRDAIQADDIPFSTAQLIGRALRIDRVGYGDLSAKTEIIGMSVSWASPELAQAADQAFISASLEALKRGDLVVVEDARAGGLPVATAEAADRMGLRSFLIAPLMERSRLVAFVYAGATTERRWNLDEIGFVREVAERSRIAMSHRHAEEVLASLATTLEHDVAARTAELSKAEEALRQAQKMEAIGQLTGNVAHDFNNLLTVIRAATDLLKRPDVSAERRERYVDAISDTTDRAAKLTGQLLAFARRQALKLEIIDVGRNIIALSDVLKTLTGSRIAVSIDLPDRACFVNLDRSQLDTALVNIAINARDAMDGAGRLDIAVRAVSSIPPIRTHPAVPGQFVMITISDTGVGIAPEQIDRIFEPFFTTKEVGQGTGLGLSQVFGFVKQSGGNIAVTSEPGRGARFSLYLPAVEEVVATQPDESADTITDSRRLRVLVVEDNAEVGRFTAESLAELGHEAVWVVDAEKGLRELRKDRARFDTVFSDVVLPGMSGIEFARIIRVDYPDVAVVLTSGFSNVQTQEAAYDFDLLHKPYSVEQLAQILRKVINTKRDGTDVLGAVLPA